MYRVECWYTAPLLFVFNEENFYWHFMSSVSENNRLKFVGENISGLFFYYFGEDQTDVYCTFKVKTISYLESTCNNVHRQPSKAKKNHGHSYSLTKFGVI